VFVPSVVVRASLLGLATLSTIACTADSPHTGTAEQDAVTQLPPNLNLTLNAKSSLTISAFTQVSADVGSSGLSGAVLFDVSSNQSFFNSTLANTVTINTGATVGRIFGNDITLNGNAAQELIGVDPRQLPQVPAVTPSTPGTTSVSTGQNQAKQLCPGQYGTITLGVNSVLNLNGGVYQVQKLVLGDGARLEPSEPVVILVAGAMTSNIGSIIRPSSQSIGPMSAASIRIEVGGAIALGDSNQIRAHLLGAGKVTTGTGLNLAGAIWGKNVTIGTNGFISPDGVFAAQTPAVPLPCNDNNACTADACVNLGATGFCSNTPVPSGTSCTDGNTCNGDETCDGAGTCQPGLNAASGTSCTDGNACNGDETCNGFGGCAAGTPPVVDDGNTCTADSCDPSAGVIHNNLPDGTTCAGIGTCTNGTCSVQGATFSAQFFEAQTPVQQCSDWNDFQFNRLTSGSYSRIAMNGTFDTNGVTCSNPSAATQICNALHNNTSTAVFCDGHTWFTGFCGGLELNVDSGVCTCSFSPTVRPCEGGPSWGGIGTFTCGGPTQTMTVTCE
jgi:prepilin-type processing-associated H-X9-DG protein